MANWNRGVGSEKAEDASFVGQHSGRRVVQCASKGLDQNPQIAHCAIARALLPRCLDRWCSAWHDGLCAARGKALPRVEQPLRHLLASSQHCTPRLSNLLGPTLSAEQKQLLFSAHLAESPLVDQLGISSLLASTAELTHSHQLQGTPRGNCFSNHLWHQAKRPLLRPGAAALCFNWQNGSGKSPAEAGDKECQIRVGRRQAGLADQNSLDCRWWCRGCCELSTLLSTKLQPRRQCSAPRKSTSGSKRASKPFEPAKRAVAGNS